MQNENKEQITQIQSSKKVVHEMCNIYDLSLELAMNTENQGERYVNPRLLDYTQRSTHYVILSPHKSKIKLKTTFDRG